jgi:tRNA (guanine-N7-)-methyltransferase
MKPKNLKFPFKWEERTPQISNGVLFVPQYYDKHHEWPKDDWHSLFQNYANKNVEYCSGNGTWIIEKAKQDPEVLWIAVEKRFDRVRKIWSKKQNYNIHNLLIVCGEAYVFSRYYLNESSLDHVFVNFPDPWPKEKHAKNRLLQKNFVEELSRLVKKGGTTTLVTDDEPYSGQIIFEMCQSKLWDPCFQDPYYRTEWPGYGDSYFDQLWREKGRMIRYMQFENIKE